MSVRRVATEYPITCCVSFNGILALFAGAFTGPTFATFQILVGGAVLLHRRHTVTNMIRAVGLRQTHHARFHRFFSQAAWELWELWRRFVLAVVRRFFAPQERIPIGVDDTAAKRTGAKIYAAGVVHDNRPAVHKAWSFCWGHKWVVGSVLVRVRRWADHVYALPVGTLLYRKEKLCRAEQRPFRTKPQLALELVEKLVSWLPGRLFLLLVDGQYAARELLRRLPACVAAVGRLRHDAALYALAPPRRKRRGRPRKRGRRLPTPKAAVRHRSCGWERVEVRGKVYEVASRVVLWWTVFGERPIRMVASRRPGGKPQFFYSTDLAMSAAEVVGWYASRWPIEVMIREAKERMGFEEPQCRVEKAVERTPPFLLLVLGLVHYWFLSQEDPTLVGPRPRWYGQRRGPDAAPTFSEMLAALRRATWHERISSRSPLEAELRRNLEAVVELASMAA